MNTFRELDDAVKALPLWKQIAWAFELISLPEIEEAVSASGHQQTPSVA